MADPSNSDDSNPFGTTPPAPDPNDPNQGWDYNWLNPYGQYIASLPDQMPGPLSPQRINGPREFYTDPQAYFAMRDASNGLASFGSDMTSEIGQPSANWARPISDASRGSPDLGGDTMTGSSGDESPRAIRNLSSFAGDGSANDPFPFAHPQQPVDALTDLQQRINAAPIGLNNIYQGPEGMWSTPQMTGPWRDPAMEASNILAGLANWAGSKGDLEQSAVRTGNALLQKYLPPSLAYALEAPIKAPLTRLFTGQWPEIDNGDWTIFPTTEQAKEPLTQYGLINRPDLTPQDDREKYTAAAWQGVGGAVPDLITKPEEGFGSILWSLTKGAAQGAGKEWLNDHATTQDPQKLAAMDSGIDAALNPDDWLAQAQFLVNFLGMGDQNASQPGN